MRCRDALPFLSALLFLVAAAFPVTGQGSRRAYIGGAYGSFDYEEDGNVLNTDVDFNESDNSYKIYGGYRIGRSQGVELSYNDYGDLSGSASGNPDVRAESDASAFIVYGVGYLNLAGLELFGKAGTAYWNAETTYTRQDTGAVEETENSGFDVALGAGAQYPISDHITLRGEIETIITRGGHGDGVDGIDQLFTTAGLHVSF